MFQHDGASVRTTTRWLQQKRVRLFWGDRWPPNSPDMNPIEHLWPMVTQKLSGKVFSGKEALWVALQSAFASITRSQVDRLYQSMPSRLAALKLARGGTPAINPALMVHLVVNTLVEAQQCNWSRLGVLACLPCPPTTSPPEMQGGCTNTYA